MAELDEEIPTESPEAGPETSSDDAQAAMANDESGARGLREIVMICAAACGSFFAIAGGGLAIGEDIDLVWVIQRGAGVLAVMLFFSLELPTFRTLRRDRLWQDTALQPWLRIMVALRWGVIVAIAVTGLALEPVPAVVIIFAAAFTVLLALYWVLVTSLHQVIETKAEAASAPPVRRGFIWTPPGGATRPAAVSYSPPPIIDRLIAALRRAWRTRVRMASAAVVLAALPVICGAGAAIGFILEHKRKPEVPRTTSTVTVTKPAPSNSKTSPGKPTTKPHQEEHATPAAPSWGGTWCPKPLAQPNVSPSAVASITELYEREAESDLPLSQEGCLGHIYPRHFHHEFYAEVAGIDPATLEQLSYCVDSERYGTFIVLAAVAPLVEALIRRVGPVGGVGRFPLSKPGRGEVYLIRAPLGIYAFVRRRPTEVFHEIPPTVARAWLGKMNEIGWLWPSAPVSGPHHTELYRLRSDNPFDRVEATITLHTENELATRDQYRYWSNKNKRKKTELSLAELSVLAGTA